MSVNTTRNFSYSEVFINQNERTKNFVLRLSRMFAKSKCRRQPQLIVVYRIFRSVSILRNMEPNPNTFVANPHELARNPFKLVVNPYKFFYKHRAIFCVSIPLFLKQNRFLSNRTEKKAKIISTLSKFIRF